MKEAAFSSHANEHDARCHPETRIALREEIVRWSDDTQGEIIFWLNGMAGTGKSTISRTIAQDFADKGILGASFFFKRGERDRGNAARLFTTIACQLVAQEATLAPKIQTAIEKDPNVVSRSLKDQFEQLVLNPLAGLEYSPANIRTVVLLVDALDECERDDDIRLIIHLMSQGSVLRPVRLKIFPTSRPELPIRLGFKNIEGKFQDIVLHQISEQIVKSDIAIFLDHNLTRIRNDYNKLSPSDRHLAQDWPGSSLVEVLAQMAAPLFIFAATICRFIEDQAWSDPDGQLQKILQYQSKTHESEIDKLDATYRPILDQLMVGSPAAQRSIVKEFQIVVGSIVLLAEPLSASSLSSLLGVPGSMIDRRLMSLHSVMHVPSSPQSPIRMLHLSFRDFPC